MDIYCSSADEKCVVSCSDAIFAHRQRGVLFESTENEPKILLFSVMDNFVLMAACFYVFHNPPSHEHMFCGMF